MGEPAFVSEEFSHNSELDVELVTTSGYGKNGALCVLQRSIRPQVCSLFIFSFISILFFINIVFYYFILLSDLQIITTFDLPGYENFWTVIHSVTSDNRGKSETEGTHGFLILTQEESTMVNF